MINRDNDGPGSGVKSGDFSMPLSSEEHSDEYLMEEGNGSDLSEDGFE